jgi:hypothetical protein
LDQKDSGLLDNFFEFTLYKGESRKYLKRYNITELPTILVIDGNGKELYRYNDYTNPTGMKDALRNFVIPKYFLMNDLNNFHEKKTFDSAIRIAQLYLDYSLKVDMKFRKNVYSISEAYLEEAQKLAGKSKACLDYCQKLELVSLFQMAYKKDFSILKQKLAAIDVSTLDERSGSYYYFLKYITAKAMKTEDFPQIEKAAMQARDFDSFVKKTDLILADLDLAQSN